MRSSAPTKLPQTKGETFMTEHETNLRDLAAMFAMAALIVRLEQPKASLPRKAFDLANEFMEERNKHVTSE